MATSIVTAMAYKTFLISHYPIRKLILCGGGAKNLFVQEWLQKLLSPIEVKTSESMGIPCTEVESIAFALFAIQTLRAIPINDPKATGAKSGVICGQIAYPTPFPQIDRVRNLLLR